MAPELTVVVPIYNEEEILEESVRALVGELANLADAEILLAENGSVDATVAIGERLGAEFGNVSLFSVPEPNYGRALREGILRARGEYVICEEIDLCDHDFHRRALHLLRERRAELVVGSKAMPGANDQRPVLRRFATRVINQMLRVAVDFQGTDTHGLKAFRREMLIPVAEACVVEHDLFASEFVVRSGRAGLRVLEIPVEVREKRRPAIHLVRRVPSVLSNLVRLTHAIRTYPGPGPEGNA